MNSEDSVGLLRALLVTILWLLIGSIVLLHLLNASLDFGRCIGDLIFYFWISSFSFHQDGQVNSAIY